MTAESEAGSARSALAGARAWQAVELPPELRRGVEAADGTGRPLFTGVRAMPWPEARQNVAENWISSSRRKSHRK